MQKMKAAGIVLLCAVLLPAAEKIPGQRPLVLIGDTFQFLPGSWATYSIFDKAKSETIRLTFAVLEPETVKGKSCHWIEVAADAPGSPPVVTRFLAEDTRQGPGELLKAIVQVEGYSPFTVPKKFIKKGNQEVAPVQPAVIVRRLEKKTIDHKGRRITAWVVEAEDAQKRKMTATVSEELPPIAVYDIDHPDMRMTVEDWGMNASSRIRGEPISFTLWLLEQIGKGLEGNKK